MSAARAWLAAAARELTYSARMLRKSPGVVALAAGALALGIGLTTIMFSIVHGALLEGLPFEDSDRIVHLERTNLSEGIESMEVTLHDFLDWRERQTSFTDLAAFYDGTVNVSGAERAERFEGAFITPAAFRILGVDPVLGRTFVAEDDDPGSSPVVLLGWHVWQDRYGGDASVIGSSIRVNSEPATVVGVMPEGFRFPVSSDVWVPLRLDPAEVERGEGTTLEVFGKLREGVDLDRASAEMSTIAARLAEAYPETNEGVGALLKPYTDEFIGDEPKSLLWTMMGAVLLVLLIACANVANLLLARTAERAREMAVRSALGASRARIVGQILSESLVLAVVGALVGTGIAWVGIALFNRAIAPTDPPFWIDIGLDPTVLLFIAAVTVAAALLAGVVPALQATGENMNEILKDESRGSSGFRVGRLSRGLVIGEVALSVGLLVAAGLMVRSIVNIQNVDYAFEDRGVLTARLGLFEAAYPNEESRRAFYDELLPRLDGTPGVRSAALATSLPGLWSYGTRFAVEGETYERDQDHPEARFVATTPGYFETFDVTPIEGRGIDAADRPGSLPVAVVNESFAARYFPGGSPVGRRIRMGTGVEPGADEEPEPWRTIVGVVPDMHLSGIENEEPEGFYVPLAQADYRFISLVLRTAGDPGELASRLPSVVAGLDRDVPLYWVRTLEEAVAQENWFYGVFGTLFMVFGAAALFLASVGLYGVMATSVSRRTHEMGIRMALGAQPGDVRRLVLRQGLVRIGIGVGIGLLLAAGLSRTLDILLFDVEPWDPLIFGAVVALLVATGVAASWVPSLRATRVDPMVALRYE